MHKIRHAIEKDSRSLAELINLAGEGLPLYLWGLSSADGQAPIEFGEQRAKRTEGGFSYRNAWVCEVDGTIAAMLLAYPQDDPYLIEDITAFPEVVRPLIELESECSGSFYINALAAYPQFQGQGLGSQLLALAEEKAREFACSEISLIVADGNEQPCTLYEFSGFHEYSQRPIVRYPGLPASHKQWILMVKTLSN